MIPKVTMGARVYGLLRYLWGPGRANEHADPRIVAAYADIDEIAPTAGAGDRWDVTALAAHLDAPHVALGDRGMRQYVWQCSLSLPADEGTKDDATWQAMATRFVELMGFADTPERAGCRWVVVHHGQSARGNDHVHLVVTLATEDGMPVWLRGDKRRAQQAADQIETEFGLLKRTPGRVGAAARAETTQAEYRKAAATGQPVEREVLRRMVRAAAGSAASELEFVAALKGAGLVVKTRADANGLVGGYAVAVADPATSDAAWFSGSRLDADLSLPKLRARRWPGAAAATAQEWTEQPAAGAKPLSADAQRHALGRIDEALAEVANDLPRLPVAEWPATAHAAADVLTVIAETYPKLELKRAADLYDRATPPAHAAHDGIQARALHSIARALRIIGRPGNRDDGALAAAVIVAALAIVLAVIEARNERVDAHRANAARAAYGPLGEIRAQLQRTLITERAHLGAPNPVVLASARRTSPKNAVRQVPGHLQPHRQDPKPNRGHSR